jgi:UDP-N-acetylmuramate: L-alanyl-gamma-D-glutamyl-meso-diaminopimelate ligase
VISRGNPLIEAILDAGRPYSSGPQWLYENVLIGKWVLAVAGTHGKTTTASMLAWILERAGLEPGFLIGGVPIDFGVSARLSDSAFFVIEADEYDTAFFDKRSKFVHYRPRTAILNNLEYDHADIFPDLAAIETQFHYFVRMVPPSDASSSTARSRASRACLPADAGRKSSGLLPPDSARTTTFPRRIGKLPTTAALRATVRDKERCAGRASTRSSAGTID